MITILFDIDGTLIRSGGAGMLAIGQAMDQMFQLPDVPGIEVHGRTDLGILTEIFSKHSLSFEEHQEDFNHRYWQALPLALANSPGEILPGVNRLLAHLHARSDVALGLLTGNSERAAAIKLDHFQLSQYFPFGGFGDNHADRNQVAHLAKESARQYLGAGFEPDRLWVVGDTIHDVTCARSIAASVVAVETGGVEPELLRNAQPDLQLACLSDTQAFCDHVVGR